MKRSILLSCIQGCAHHCFVSSPTFLPPSAQAGAKEGALVPLSLCRACPPRGSLCAPSPAPAACPGCPMSWVLPAVALQQGWGGSPCSLAPQLGLRAGVPPCLDHQGQSMKWGWVLAGSDSPSAPESPTGWVQALLPPRQGLGSALPREGLAPYRGMLRTGRMLRTGVPALGCSVPGGCSTIGMPRTGRVLRARDSPYGEDAPR